ncbi:MAG: hypothetical protein DLM59_02370 [Pseudonocardiales bacterium]|nr:MAG: hypothetical protein DLM59_02370 [Pseudonocardiales bacterium]
MLRDPIADRVMVGTSDGARRVLYGADKVVVARRAASDATASPGGGKSAPTAKLRLGRGRTRPVGWAVQLLPFGGRRHGEW